MQDSGRRGTYLAAAALLATGMLIVLLLPDDPLEHLARAVDAARARPGLAMLGLAALQVLTSVFLGPVWPGMAAAGYLFGVPLEALPREFGTTDTVLVKGSRSAHMERVVNALRAAEVAC